MDQNGGSQVAPNHPNFDQTSGFFSLGSPDRPLVTRWDPPGLQEVSDKLPEDIGIMMTTGWWLGHPSEKYESQLG